MDLSDLSALLGEEPSAGASGVWVILPDACDERSALPGSALLGEARRLADSLGCHVHAVVGAEGAAQACFSFGADRVHVSANAGQYLGTQQPEFVFFSSQHNAAAAQFAESQQAGLVTSLRHPITVDLDTRFLIGQSPVYCGEYEIVMALSSSTKVATFDEHYLARPNADPQRTGTVAMVASPAPEARLRDLGPADGFAPPVWRPLVKARTIVSVGRGVHDEAGVDLARRLAAALGGELAGDRSALASGWIDEAHEVGVHGTEVAPAVYLALGIAGDTAHNAAITGARKVVAVHHDENAAIFKAADVGVVADAKDFLPLLLEAVERGNW